MNSKILIPGSILWNENSILWNENLVLSSQNLIPFLMNFMNSGILKKYIILVWMKRRMLSSMSFEIFEHLRTSTIEIWSSKMMLSGLSQISHFLISTISEMRQSPHGNSASHDLLHKKRILEGFFFYRHSGFPLLALIL